MNDIFSVLADPTRRAILEALTAKPLSVGELVALTQEGQPTISKHLKTLREAGLVAATAVGQARVYSIDVAPLAEVELFLARLGMADAVTAKPEADADFAALMGDAGEKLGSWIAAGATWLNGQLSEKIADVNIDPEALGKDVGRKLADAKLAAATAAVDTEAQVREEISRLSARLGEQVSEIRASGFKDAAAKFKASRVEGSNHD